MRAVPARHSAPEAGAAAICGGARRRWRRRANRTDSEFAHFNARAKAAKRLFEELRLRSQCAQPDSPFSRAAPDNEGGTAESSRQPRRPAARSRICALVLAERGNTRRLSKVAAQAGGGRCEGRRTSASARRGRLPARLHERARAPAAHGSPARGMKRRRRLFDCERSSRRGVAALKPRLRKARLCSRQPLLHSGSTTMSSARLKVALKTAHELCSASSAGGAATAGRGRPASNARAGARARVVKKHSVRL